MNRKVILAGLLDEGDVDLTVAINYFMIYADDNRKE